MHSEFSWNESVSLLSIGQPASFLKFVSASYGIEIQSIAEIGVYRGGTSVLFRAFFPQAALYLVDPWVVYPDYLTNSAAPTLLSNEEMEESYRIVKENFSEDPKTQILRLSSVDAAPIVPDNLDLIFIDGNHSYPYVLQDLKTWAPKVRSGKIISGHDYNQREHPEVVKAVDEYFKEGVQVGSDFTWFAIQK